MHTELVERRSLGLIYQLVISEVREFANLIAYCYNAVA